MKCKQFCQGFELELPYSFPATLTITLRILPIYVYVSLLLSHPWWVVQEPLKSKWPQLSKTLLHIAVDFRSPVVLIISILSLFSDLSSFCSSYSGIVPRTPTTIASTVTFMFDSFFLKFCCILTFDRAGCSSSVNKVITGKQAMRGCKKLMWVYNRNAWAFGNYIYTGTESQLVTKSNSQLRRVPPLVM